MQNVCSFNALGSTDESPSGLTYSWAFGGTQGTASGPLPTKIYSAPGTFDVVLTVKDEWNATHTDTVQVTITEPTTNAPPVPVLTTNCSGLTCGVTAAGTTDPNAGDVITYAWSWGDATSDGTGQGAVHTYASPGTYTVTLTATDGWGESATTTQSVSVSGP